SDMYFVLYLIALTREFLHHVHLIGMEEAAAREPCRINERDGVEHQRVGFPAPNGISVILGLDRLLRIVLAAVGRDDAIFPLSAAAIGRLGVAKDNVVSRLNDSCGRTLPRNSQRLAR